MAGQDTAGLNDADPERRNEALNTENGHLRYELAKTQAYMEGLTSRVNMMCGVQEMGIVAPEDVRKLYTAIDEAIQAFLEPMYHAILQRQEHKAGIMAQLNQPTAFPIFRNSLQNDLPIRKAALDPYANIMDIWTAYIWKVLYATVFREQAVQSFYSGDGKSAAAYMKTVDEIVDLMKQSNPPVFGEYVRRLWRRQALAAIFRTAKFDWVEQRRTAKIHEIRNTILRAFIGFRTSVQTERRAAMVSAQNIVEAAVRLNEHIMIEADDLWTIQLYGLAGGDFHASIKDFDLRPAGTAAAVRDSGPLDTISDRFSPQDLQNRVRPLCIIAPALRVQQIDGEQGTYQASVDLVKPRVLVSLRQPAPAAGAQVPPPGPPEELIFYTLAQNMGLVK